MDGLLVFNVKSWGDNLTNDSTNTMPSFFKRELSNDGVFSKDTNLFCVGFFFSKIESIFGVTQVMTYLENSLSKKKRSYFTFLDYIRQIFLFSA